MPDEVLTKQRQDHLPLHRNTMPVAECDVHDTTIAGKACKAIDVPILGCASIWLRVQREAEAWVAPGGKLIADPIARNRRINQAYAQLWLADRRFQWAGLAAFASKQVGCGLLHAAENIRRSQQEIDANNHRLDIMSSSDGTAVNSMPATIAGSAAYMYQQLALGNTTLFLDIYPLHRFYMLRGFDHFRKCLDERKLIVNDIIWPIGQAKLAFGQSFRAILEGFDLIDKGLISESVKRLAHHEQINILQTAIYSDVMMRRALDANQFAWAVDFPSGVAAEIALTLSAKCRVDRGSFTIAFSKNKSASLYDQNQRMSFVYAAAAQFNNLLSGSGRADVEASITEIARDGKPR
ncbi:hypothetical protein GJ699_22010 [Duganella sp. FT80W]|uniref:Uncharacterized protein n=1 Tax=Duganella guangzhouensis TaxID=2666084 RepID=A0A6I2L636_9BURK|nr:hypothetical protein [Duganella guangzhouensis]MRW92677.1 hypothetical protein [Duganella guangzhouensis]